MQSRQVMYIETLKVFCDLASTGSFSKAGTLNGVSQSAVSQQVGCLEKKLKVTLLKRGGRTGVVLTEEGTVFLDACRQILATYERLEGQLREMQAGAELEIKIAAIYCIGMHDLPNRIKHFHSLYPHATVRVDYWRDSQIYDAVKEGIVDFGLVAFPSRMPGIHVEVYREDDLMLVCAKGDPLSLKPKAELSDIVGKRFISFSLETSMGRALTKSLAQANLRIEPYRTFDNVEAIKKAVEIEGGVALIPWDAVCKEVERGVLVALPLEAVSLRRQLGVVSRRNSRKSALVEAFLDLLRKEEIEDILV